MRRLYLAFACLAVTIAVWGCDTTPLIPDLALVPPGCRAPNLCYYSPGEVPGCDCTRPSTESSLGAPGGCVQCNPTLQDVSVQQCTCTPEVTGMPLVCLEARMLCVGHGPLCPGDGARCVDPRTIPAGKGACDVSGGEPPTFAVPPNVDGGEAEPLCAFTDDVCCPGSEIDMAVPDLGEPDDLLSATD